MKKRFLRKVLPIFISTTLSFLMLAGCASTAETATPEPSATEAAAEATEENQTDSVETANPNTIIYNGVVLETADGVENATAVVIENDKIVYVGSDEGAKAFENEASSIIDAAGNTIMPTITDSHLHFSTAIPAKYEIDLADVIDVEEMQDIISEFVETNPDLDVYSGTGWMQSSFDIEVGPTADILDEVCPDKPMFLQNVDGHGYWANTKALEHIEELLADGIDGVVGNSVAEYNSHSQENGGRIVTDKDGNPSGWLKEAAGSLLEDLFPDYSVEECKEAILEQQEWLHSLGFTHFYDAGVLLSGKTVDNYYTAMKELAEAGELKVVVHSSFWVQPYDFNVLDADGNYDKEASSKALAEYLGSWKKRADELSTTEYFKVTTIKFMADQVLEGGTAYLNDGMYSDEYVNEALNGSNETNNIWEGKEDLMIQAFNFAADNGLNLHVHTIGDAAVSLFLDCLEKAVVDHPVLTENRVAMAHCQFATDADKQRMADLNVSAVVSPYWSCMDDYYWDVYLPIMSSQEMLDTQYPMQSFEELGVNCAFHSDYVVTAPDMGWMLYTAMTRTLPAKIYDVWYEGYEDYYQRSTDPNASQNIEDYGEDVMPILPLQKYDERLTFAQTIDAATINGMKTINLDDTCGTIEEGKLANILVLNMDIEKTANEDIESIQDATPVYTIFEGEIVFSDAE